MRDLPRMISLLTALLAAPTMALGDSFDELPTWKRAGYTAYAAAADVVPVVSATVAPKCLPGYFVCKIAFAAVGYITAAEQLVMSGGSDLDQTRALMHRGLRGDWVLTGRHASGALTPDPLPDPLPVAGPSASTGE